MSVAANLNSILADATFPDAELDRRRVLATDLAQEKAALHALAASMLDEPEAVLPRFVELAMAIGGGVSAGLSLHEPGTGAGVFRWRYLHGSLSAFEGASTPRDFSPCGVTLDRRAPVLAVHAERAYSWISDVDIIVPELLLVPLFVGRIEPLGTLWIVSETVGHFHHGHARALTELATFVGIALKMIESERELAAVLEEQSLLAQEMNHRVKNLFAVTDGMIRMSTRSAATKEELADNLSGRLHALASAHSLVSRHLHEVGRPPRASDFHSVLDAVLKPHDGGSRTPSFLELEGPRVKCGDRSINGLALVFHELATNAAKYGALSVAGGTVSIHWETDGDDLLVRWTERGGPQVSTPPASGFGGSLIRNTVTRQFAGSVDYEWREDGLTVTIRMRLERIVT